MAKFKLKSSIYLFLVPSLAIITVFFIIPAILTFLIGLTDMDWTFKWHWIGLKNFEAMIKEKWMTKIFNNTLFYVFTTLSFFNVGMALIVSLLTHHIHEKIGTAIRAIWLLPRITPSTVYALLWLWASRPEETSLFNWIFTSLGYEPKAWLLEQPWLIVILVNGFVGTSFGMIIFTAALKSIPVDYLRAAIVDGASTWQLIRHVELPLIRWPIMFVTAYQTLSLLTSYEYILLVTDGGPGFYTTEVLALYSYHQAFKAYGGVTRFGYGAALATILVIIGLAMSVLYWKMFKMKELMLEPRIEVD
ncbi:MAG: sugar ABC transporter permease [Thermoprotei archaeon]|nr:MAG: sugar ABC transporter permease [Thermoprotei archaeon]